MTLIQYELLEGRTPLSSLPCTSNSLVTVFFKHYLNCDNSITNAVLHANVKINTVLPLQDMRNDGGTGTTQQTCV